jgi:hypothetical protein
MDTGISEPALDGSADDVAVEMATLSRSSSKSVDTDGHASCRKLIQVIYSEFDNSQYFEFDLKMTKLREGSAAACPGCVLFLDAIDTSSDGHLLGGCIDGINVWLGSWNVLGCYEIYISLYYLPNTALLPQSSPGGERDLHSAPGVDIVTEEASLPLLKIQLEMFLLQGMWNLSLHSVV